MKHVYIFIIICFITNNMFAQQNPVVWSYSAKEQQNNEYLLTFQAQITPGWYIYSQTTNGDGPIPTSINLTPSSEYLKIGEVKEKGNEIRIFDKALEKEVTKFANSVTYIMKVKVNKKNAPVKGYIEFMCCNKKSCLPPAIKEFIINLNDQAPQVAFNLDGSKSFEPQNGYSTSLPIKRDTDISTPVIAEISTEELRKGQKEVNLESDSSLVASNILKFMPKSIKNTVNNTATTAPAVVIAEEPTAKQSIDIPKIQTIKEIAEINSEPKAEKITTPVTPVAETNLAIPNSIQSPSTLPNENLNAEKDADEIVNNISSSANALTPTSKVITANNNFSFLNLALNQWWILAVSFGIILIMGYFFRIKKSN